MTHQDQSTQAFAPLGIVGKNRFPFTLACPSFVYPAGYVDNVRRLAPFVDQVQLLFFESRPESLPSPELTKELSDLAASASISYNVHLPSDVYLGHPDASERRRAIDTLGQVIERCTSLAPHTFTLHLNRNPQGCEPVSTADWQALTIDSLNHLLPPGSDHRRISVETLDFPFEETAPVVSAADLSVCMDMGHLMVQGLDIDHFYETWKTRITIVHLHGVDGLQDHLPLNRLDDRRMQAVLKILSVFSGVVCLEVYSRVGLDNSLAHLVDQWFGAKANGA